MKLLVSVTLELVREKPDQYAKGQHNPFALSSYKLTEAILFLSQCHSTSHTQKKKDIRRKHVFSTVKSQWPVDPNFFLGNKQEHNLF